MSWAEQVTGQLGEALSGTGATVIGVGAADDDGRVAVVEPAEHIDARFEVGSVVKTMTATIVAGLGLDGVLSLDDPVSRWLDAGDNGSVTVAELAAHTSGLPRLAPNAHTHDGHVDDDPYAAFTAELAEEGLRAAERAEVGSYAYSNFGYQLLGLIAERAAGEPFADLLRHRVFEPCGMAGARVHPDTGVLRGHDDSGRPAGNWNLTLAGPGGVNLTIADLVAYTASVAAGEDGPLGKALGMAIQPRADGPGAKIGLGWLLHPAGIACHGGGTAGFSSYMAVHLETKRGVAVLLDRHVGDVVQTAALAAAAGKDPVQAVPRPFEGDSAPWAERALGFFGHFVAGDFEAARAAMHPQTAESLTTERIAPVWAATTGRTGPLGEPVVDSVERLGSAVRVTVTAAGDQATATMLVSFLDDAQVVGVLLR